MRFHMKVNGCKQRDAVMVSFTSIFPVRGMEVNDTNTRQRGER
jgi:hypothetical protein